MSTHIHKYLFESGLAHVDVIQEMSDKALDDILASDDGLEVSKKAKFKGKLDPAEDWTLQKIEYLEGPHGEPEYESCENCQKNIRYVCTITGNDDDEKLVGPDCALTLLAPGSADAKSVEDYVGKRIKKNKFVKNAIKLFSDLQITAEEHAAHQKLEKLIIAGHYKNGKGVEYVKKDPRAFAIPVFLNNLKNADYLVSTLLSGNAGVIYKEDPKPELISGIAGFAVKTWIAEILASPEKVQALSQAFEQVWKDDVSLKNKKYFYDPSHRGFISEFLEEFKDTLGGTKSIF